MIRRFPSLAMIILLLAYSLPAAEVIPGKWQKVDMLEAGSPIIIKTKYGEKLKCTYFDSNRESLLIVENGGGQRRIRKEDVESVIAEKYDDRLFNGAVIGLSVGVGATLLTAALSKDSPQRNRVNLAVFGSILFGLTGMGIGSLVDFHHRGSEVIYTAIRQSD